MDYSFGNWVKRRRKTLDLTQQELAQRVGCSLSTIFKIESDERRPSRQVAELLAQHLEIPPDQTELFLKVARQEKTLDALGEFSFPNLRPKDNKSNIPSMPGLLVGREFELAEVTRLIQDSHCHLLTLTGPGGVGKTHLAIHTAKTLVNADDEKQVFFVGLAPITGREQSVTAIADALGVVLYAASDRSVQLISYLQDKELVLILDNFDHLTTDEHCIALVNDILRGSKKIKIITTSRQPLHLQAEWIFEVQGLPVPKSDKTKELETNTAVTLFIKRAGQALAGFKPTSADLSAIAQICKLVEGLPLGIELAAPWVRTLTCAEIVNEIQKSIDFLETSLRDLPERHRSIRATIEYSWNLLTTEEQRVLRQLTIFRGGFDRQSGEVVANASLPVLMALVSKSLIQRTESGRYDMHELIRQYALEHLQQDDSEIEQVRRMFVAYYANLLEQRGSALKGEERTKVVVELVSDLPNLRQAWSWAASKQLQAAELSRSADTLFWLYESRSNCREGVPLFARAVEGLQTVEQKYDNGENGTWQLALGQALSYQGYFLFRQGQHLPGQDALKSSLAILEEIPECGSLEVQSALSNTMIFLGAVTSVLGEFAEGERLLYIALQMKKALGDLWGSAFCLRYIGLSASNRGDYDESYISLEQSLAISRELGNTWAIASSLNQLGMVAFSRNEYEQAREYLSDGLELSRELEDRASIAAALDGLGLVSAAQNQDQEARSLFQESIALWMEIGEQGSLAQTLIHYGNTLLKLEDVAAARKQFQESLSVASAARITPILLEALLGEAEIRITYGETESAFVILKALSQHPSASHATRYRAEELYSSLRLQSSEQNEITLQAQDMPVVIAEFVAEVLTTKLSPL